VIFKNKCTEIVIRHVSVNYLLKVLSMLFTGINRRLRHLNNYFIEVFEFQYSETE